MRNLIIVDNLEDWPLDLPDAEIVSMQAYLTSADFKEKKRENVRVFNLCRSYRYQTGGYYVSLLAAARGHKPIPSISTIQDMKSQTIVRMASEELHDLIESSLIHIKSNEFVLSVYFGRNMARRYDKLSFELFRMFNAPFVRAHFKRSGHWQLRKVGPIPASEIPKSHHQDVVEFTKEFFAGRRAKVKRKEESRYDLAILVNPHEEMPPSDEKALHRFSKAAEKLRFAVEFITKSDYARLAEFDALFIRETTNVNHHTYRFARRAAAEGLIVIDDPDSILKCTNKVYLAELLEKNNIPAPKTFIIHKDNVDEVMAKVAVPCILKQPDSAFSQGVIKVSDPSEFRESVLKLLGQSELVIAQEFVPTEFDWRVGIIDGEPIYACKYHMARNHWQIIKRDDQGKLIDGKADTLPVELAPRKLISTAVKAAHLIGDGLYGVDLKQFGDKYYVIEVNDNPSIDSGVEDAVLKERLYLRIMESFVKRLTIKKEGRIY